MIDNLYFKNKIRHTSFYSSVNLDLVISLILFLLTFVIYIKYLAPTIFKGDSADATMAAYFLGIPHPPGFPVYTWVGHLFTYIPVGDVAYRVNLMSAFFGALVISAVYMIIRTFTTKSKDGFENFRSRCGAILGALSLAFSINFWSSAEVAEVNTFYSFILVSMIIVVLIWVEKRDIRFLYLLSLLFSISVGTYAVNVLYIPSFLAFIYLVDNKVLTNKKTLVYFIGIFIAIGLIQMLYLYMRAFQAPLYAYTDIRNINDFFNFLTAKEYSYMLFSLPLSKGTGLFFTYLLSNVSMVGVVIGMIGIVFSLKRNKLWSAFLMSIFFINVLFFAQYNSFDIREKFIPSYIIFSIFIGLGIWEILGLLKLKSDSKTTLETSRKRNKQTLETRNRYSIPQLIFIASVLLIAAYIPYISYVSHSQEASNYGDSDLPVFLNKALTEVHANSTIIDSWELVEQLKYFQLIYHVNPTVEILGANYNQWPDLIHERINRKDVYLLRKDQNLMNKYNEIPVLYMPKVGILFKVSTKN